MNTPLTLGILTTPGGWETHYINACKELGVPYKIIDIVSDDWYEQTVNSGVDGLLVRPAGTNEVIKQLYSERLFFIEQYLKIPLYPSYLGVQLYENKRMQHYWMTAHGINHPVTHIFYDRKSALEFFMQTNAWPFVFKPNLGGSAEGVFLIRNRRQAKRVVNRLFTRYRFFNPGIRRWRTYRYGVRLPVMEDVQRNYLFVQEFVEAKCEWRIIKAGNTYFGHQKLSDGKFFSGSGRVGWVQPPMELLHLAKHISELSGIRALNIDLFETPGGEYILNEIQTIWGGKLPYQMRIHDEPCRYVEKEGEFVLENGIFHTNRGCNLRVADFLDYLQTYLNKSRVL